MYADGAAEELVGEAIRGRRDEVFLVSKVLPQHATRGGTREACERSLRRLATDHLDLYLLHWRGGVPLRQTLEAFQGLQENELIRHWGVSNFDVRDMHELVSLDGGAAAGTNQVLYNLAHRGIEYDLLPWCQAHRLPVMAYSPIQQGDLLGHTVVNDLAAAHGATLAQVALAWVLRQDGVVAIPKAADTAHVVENRAALDVRLSPADLAKQDAAFRPPTRPQPLEML
jgi:diketogulonate reductase-like aldo/keto reductase